MPGGTRSAFDKSEFSLPSLMLAGSRLPRDPGIPASNSPPPHRTLAVTKVSIHAWSTKRLIHSGPLGFSPLAAPRSSPLEVASAGQASGPAYDRAA